MSADHNTPLFEISNGDEIEYKDNPAIAQVKANLAVVEWIQQERAEQRRLEREKQKVQVEAERLRQEIKEAEREGREIKEAEREGRELKEVELGWLTQEKERLEEEVCVEQQHVEVLCGLERVTERR